ncbi:SH3 domain-containing protein [Acinetobacter baumannii]|nr:SH3 domain-containing protein [Acinetobacter baumannii]MDN8303299.1 SH3 domain-containing protein [Acinetobacter baumannii]MDN8313619.1 SH3 domain-containing protein [Acinetobacter baumannii]MDN8327108.1 SH3 domain-containing protein [Acinetobacter baumannii]MDN8383286.1 SH3 domain-containing protein [Acinetobacter baumannii]
MKKHFQFIVFTTFMIGSVEVSYADFGFIQDKDGYVNVRGNSSLNSKVTSKLNNNEIVSCVMDEGTNNFCLVNASNGVTGFVYKNRVNTFNNGGAAAYNIVLNIKNGKLVANKAWKVEI